MAHWLVWAQATHDALHVLGQHREKGESPMTWMARLEATTTLPQSLMLLGQIESLVFYGRTAPQAHEIQHTYSVYQEILAGMHWRRRLMLMLRRAFLPLKKRDFTKA